MSTGVDALNGLLRGEISAVETYNQARERIDQPLITTAIEEGQMAHQRQVQKLVAMLQSMGAEPSEGAGAWGAFANFLEAAAGVLGDKASVDMLEQGEDHGLKVYRDEIENCEDPAVRTFIKDDLLPSQEASHNIMCNLKHTLEAA